MLKLGKGKKLSALSARISLKTIHKYFKPYSSTKDIPRGPQDRGM